MSLESIHVKLVRLDPECTDGNTEIEVPYGSTIVGRGPSFQVSDKRVSRSHAILQLQDGILKIKPVHTNPTFHKARNETMFKILEKDSFHTLNHQDYISLLPNNLKFEVKVCQSVNARESKQGKEGRQDSTAKQLIGMKRDHRSNSEAGLLETNLPLQDNVNDTNNSEVIQQYDSADNTLHCSSSSQNADPISITSIMEPEKQNEVTDITTGCRSTSQSKYPVKDINNQDQGQEEEKISVKTENVSSAECLEFEKDGKNTPPPDICSLQSKSASKTTGGSLLKKRTLPSWMMKLSSGENESSEPKKKRQSFKADTKAPRKSDESKEKKKETNRKQRSKKDKGRNSQAADATAGDDKDALREDENKEGGVKGTDVKMEDEGSEQAGQMSQSQKFSTEDKTTNFQGTQLQTIPALESDTLLLIRRDSKTNELVLDPVQPEQTSTPLGSVGTDNGSHLTHTTANSVDNPQPPAAQLPFCPYGGRCYRRNPTHFQEYSHSLPAPPAQISVTLPECPYGSRCYRKNPQHFEEFKHSSTQQTNNYESQGKRSSARQSRARHSVLDGESDNDEDEPNTYDYDDSFIDDEEDSMSSESSYEGDDTDPDFDPGSSEDENVSDLISEAKSFVGNKKMQK